MEGKKAESFNAVAAVYAQIRPGYPSGVYDEVEKYRKFDRESSILEIGSGHGIATGEISHRWQSKIIALEPGENLLTISRQQYKNFSNISFIHSTFEAYETGKRFDGIFSATAFHWPDKEIKYRKTHTLLKDDGLLVLYWNNYTINDEDMFFAIQSVYKDYHPQTAGNKDIRIIQKEKVAERVDELERSHLYNLLIHKEIIHYKTFSSEEYVNLLKSFSDHSIYDAMVMDRFYTHIKKAITEHGGTILIKIIVDLNIAKKIF